MTRGLTVAAATESAKRNGAFPVHILEIEWHDGSRYYGDGAPSPVACEPRVKDWGSLTLEATPERLGGFSDLTISMFDTDGAMRSLAGTSPGLTGAKVSLYLWFVGTSWADRITLFGGRVIRPSDYEFKDGVWKLHLAGFEKQYKQHLGRTITRAIFPDVICENCDGKLIPIVFGDPCLRVPCQVIDRPGQGWLRLQLGLFDDYLYIQNPPSNPDPTQLDPLYNPYGFTYDTTISIDVGSPGNYETITGCFCNSSDRTQFTIYHRGAFQASGTSPGTYGSGGRSYLLINQADIASPGTRRTGYLLYLLIDDEWVGFLISDWFASGTSIAVLDVTNMGLGSSIRWKISSQPSGYAPLWSVGSGVYEHGEWVYALNYLPSQHVDRIEAMASVAPQSGGAAVPTWYTYGDSYYYINRDNRTWNTALGRSAGDPGLTTASLTSSPAVLGFDSETIYATIRGITADTFGGDTLANPAKIIQKILTHRQLGNVPADQIDAYSFAVSETETHSLRMAFAITEPKQMFDVCSQLAFQAGLLHFWDQGKATVCPITIAPNSSRSVLTLDDDCIQRGSLKIEDPGETDKITELAGSYSLTCAAPESKLVRQSISQVSQFGRQRKDVSFWGFQNNKFVALMTEFWLAAFCSMQRRVTVTTYLNASHVQPGDIVKINNAVLSNVPARVQRVAHKFLSTPKGTMETIEIEAVTRLWSVDVEAAAVDLDACNPPTGDVPIIHEWVSSASTTTAAPTTSTTSTTTTGGGTTTTTTSTTTTGGSTTTSTTTSSACCQTPVCVTFSGVDSTLPACPYTSLSTACSVTVSGGCSKTGSDFSTGAYISLSITPGTTNAMILVTLGCGGGSLVGQYNSTNWSGCSGTFFFTSSANGGTFWGSISVASGSC